MITRRTPFNDLPEYFPVEELSAYQLSNLFDGMVRVAKEIKANAPEQKAKCELIERWGQDV